jgi:hypothetical protein
MQDESQSGDVVQTATVKPVISRVGGTVRPSNSRCMLRARISGFADANRSWCD